MCPGCSLSSSSCLLRASSDSWLLCFFFTLSIALPPRALSNSSVFFPALQSWLPVPLQPSALWYCCSDSLIVTQLSGDSSVLVPWSGDSTVALSCRDPELPLSPRETELQVCLAWRNHSPHLFPSSSSSSSFLSVSLTFPLLFFRSTNQQLCLEGNQAAQANYAALAAASLSPSFSSAHLSTWPGSCHAFPPCLPLSIYSCPPSSNDSLPSWHSSCSSLLLRDRLFKQLSSVALHHSITKWASQKSESPIYKTYPLKYPIAKIREPLPTRYLHHWYTFTYHYYDVLHTLSTLPSSIQIGICLLLYLNLCLSNPMGLNHCGLYYLCLSCWLHETGDHNFCVLFSSIWSYIAFCFHWQISNICLLYSGRQ